MTLSPEMWALAVLGALLVGVAKTGIGGLGMVVMALFTLVLGNSKEASGAVLPLLIVGDVFAVVAFRQHARWEFLWKLFPWTAVGVGLGYLAMGRISDAQARVLIGAIIVVMTLLHVWKKRRDARRAAEGEAETSHGVWFAPTMGVLAGFTTLVANAAGPLMALYLLAMRLPKMDFVGTGAVFFLLLNVFKVPFMVDLGLITGASVGLNVVLAPAVILGAVGGRALLKKIEPSVFEKIVLWLSAAGGVKLLWSGLS